MEEENTRLPPLNNPDSDVFTVGSRNSFPGPPLEPPVVLYPSSIIRSGINHSLTDPSAYSTSHRYQPHQSHLHPLGERHRTPAPHDAPQSAQDIAPEGESENASHRRRYFEALPKLQKARRDLFDFLYRHKDLTDFTLLLSDSSENGVSKEYRELMAKHRDAEQSLLQSWDCDDGKSSELLSTNEVSEADYQRRRIIVKPNPYASSWRSRVSLGLCTVYHKITVDGQEKIQKIYVMYQNAERDSSYYVCPNFGCFISRIGLPNFRRHLEDCMPAKASLKLTRVCPYAVQLVPPSHTSGVVGCDKILQAGRDTKAHFRSQHNRDSIKPLLGGQVRVLQSEWNAFCAEVENGASRSD
ncbi:hypothetical protein T439DRAFT_30568 [Meredithblackwellia eburnea MCA 4105]